MSVAKIAISIDYDLLKKLDDFVAKKKFKTRSQAIQIAVNDTLKRLEHCRLSEECVKLDKNFEQKLADEGIYEDEEEWPKF